MVHLRRWSCQRLGPLSLTRLALLRQELLPHKTFSVDVNINNSQVEVTEHISDNRPYRQSRRKPISTYTKGPSLSRRTTEVIPPRHEFCCNSTRKNPRPNTPDRSNQRSKPQIKLPRMNPGFPRREKQIPRPTRATALHLSHRRKCASPLQHFNTDFGRSIGDVTFENATREPANFSLLTVLTNRPSFVGYCQIRYGAL
jgi:hypothetical protein